MKIIDEIAAERKRQIEEEGWTAEHNDGHKDGSLARVAAAYAFTGSSDGRPPESLIVAELVERLWPESWNWKWFKPKSRRKNLILAGALIVTELERLARADLGRPVLHHGSGP